MLTTAGGVYEVLLPDGHVVQAVLRGRLRQQQRTGDRVVAGDDVTVARQGAGWTIEVVAERRSQIARRAPGKGAGRAKVIVANVDQVVVVFAAAHPEPHLRMLDRFLVLAGANELHALVVLNKTDLVPAEQAGAKVEAYRRAGYPVLLTSVPEHRGLDELRDALCGHRSVLAGPSGVGKSTLLNAVQPGLGLRVAEVSEAVRKGRHTTVSARLIPLECGGYVADTPGLRELGLWGVEPEDLPSLFPEFSDASRLCRFSTCTHTHEPGCGVRNAVEASTIDRSRYESYLALRQSNAL